MSLHEFVFGISPSTRARFSWLFTSHPVDRHGLSRTVPMQVLSLGMGRTGTASMHKALQILGYPTYHGFDIHANKPDNDMWIEAFDAKYRRTTASKESERWGPKAWQAFFDQLLGHVGAVTDLPCNAFAPELVAAYPAAQVVLVERELEAWYVSWEQALIRPLETPLLDWLLLIDRDTRRMVGTAREGVMRCQFRAADTTEYRANARATYTAHYAEVRGLLREQPGRLLEYRLGSGWEPLCEFLGKEVPDVPFPHVNESAVHDEMQDVIKVQMARHAVGFLFFRILPACVVLAAVYWQVVARAKQ